MRRIIILAIDSFNEFTEEARAHQEKPEPEASRKQQGQAIAYQKPMPNNLLIHNW